MLLPTNAQMLRTSMPVMTSLSTVFTHLCVLPGSRTLPL